MSVRSMLEINHDLMPKSMKEAETFMHHLSCYVRSGEAKDLPDGMTLVATRHHSGKYTTGDLDKLIAQAQPYRKKMEQAITDGENKLRKIVEIANGSLRLTMAPDSSLATALDNILAITKE